MVLGLSVVVLAFAGWLGRVWISPVRPCLIRPQSVWREETPGGVLGRALQAGLPGGFRSLASDFLWLRVNLSWERRDLEATVRNLNLVAALDPRPLVFWLNGARMLAYDMPEWRISARGGRHGVPLSVRRRIETEQAQRALAWLEEAAKFHPESPDILIECGNILLNCRHDPLAAAFAYRRAAEMPGAPHYAARLHAEMLRRAGRPAEALAWLVALHPGLPREDEAAASSLVLARIRELENELGLPPEQCYRVQEL